MQCSKKFELIMHVQLVRRTKFALLQVGSGCATLRTQQCASGASRLRIGTFTQRLYRLSPPH
eukprot:3246313-Amphidinium_carterae.1